MSIKIVSIQEAAKALVAHMKDGNCRVFSAGYTKRTDGSKRIANGRFSVTKHLKGGVAAYRPSDYKLVHYWDVNSEGYRSIPLDGIEWVQIDGQKLVVA